MSALERWPRTEISASSSRAAFGPIRHREGRNVPAKVFRSRLSAGASVGMSQLDLEPGT